jgi:hypothetical protein
MSSTTYQLTITMEQDTIDQLHQENATLLGFKSVQGPSGGKPLVWFSYPRYSLQTDFTWTESYQAYTSINASLDPDTHVVASASYPIILGQTLNVTDPLGGTGIVADGGYEGGISIANQTDTPFVCGMSQLMTSTASGPLCAFQLPGNNLDVIIPIEKVLLMFASGQVNTGTVIEKTFGSGALVDLTGPGQNVQSLTYDFNKGWGGGSALTIVAPNAELAPLLISGVPPQVALSARVRGAATRR